MIPTALGPEFSQITISWRRFRARFSSHQYLAKNSCKLRGGTIVEPENWTA